MSVRLKVREIARQKHVSMGLLSRKSNLAYRTIKMIYNDPHRDVALSTLEKLAHALNVRICDLIEELPE